jgi:WASH complex subunit 7
MMVYLQHILKPLCRDIETDLRLHIHIHLRLDERNPFKTGQKDLGAFIKCRPIRFLDTYIDIKGWQ